MSSPDWEISGSTIAVIHTTLTNPLTGSGTYCRLLTPANSSTNGHMALNTSSQFYNVPVTKALRGEACMRLSANGYPSPSGISLKSTGMLGTQYLFGLVTHFGTCKLCLWLPSQGIILSDLIGFYPARDQWINLRFEVYPLGSTADRLISYRENGIGTNNWIVVDDRTIPSTSPDYLQWSNNNRNGLFVFLAYGSDPSIGLYVDNVKFTLSSV